MNRDGLCLRCGRAAHDICPGPALPPDPYLSVRDIATNHVFPTCPCGDCAHRRNWEKLFSGPSPLNMLRYPPTGYVHLWVVYGPTGPPALAEAEAA